MRIAHYVSDLWAPGGIATYVDRLTTAQEHTGHDVIWLCHAPPDDRTLPDRMQVVTPETLYAAARQLRIDVLHAHRTLPEPLPDDLTLLRTMHGHQGGCPSGTRYLRRSGTPCDRTYHPIGCMRMHVQERCGSCRPRKMWRHFKRLRREREQTETVLTAAVSMYVQQMMARAGCNVSNIVVCPSPAPDVVPYTTPPENTPSILYAGRIAPEKGLHWLVDALAQLDTEVTLHVAGTGTDDHMESAHAQVAAQGLEDRVVFHGWCDEPALTSLLSMAWLVVVPSVWNEPAGLVPLDAAAHGRFVVASDAGGLPEYVAPNASALVPPNDTAALASTLEKVLSDYKLLADAGKRAQHHAEVTFSAPHTARAYEQLYDQASARRPAPVAASPL
ncbi:hypothetical protein CRI93_00535 [Longimonas halophila]|uniref:Glycosyl transferase family 1 domain-containing protein n=1 Tax=Longimonas halophila TaxID=1469170 RepID=A0A2H3P0Z9_9BACT|nr:glycosyltransferase family 4 protein [Longimonas halophila]PEN09250.1 hypothetical protein CRI93_00535 [Longimonas halophila]